LPASEADIETLQSRLLGEVGPKCETRAAGVSALSGEGVDALLRLIDEVLPFDLLVRATFRICSSDGASIHLLHEFGRVISTQYDEQYCIIDAEVSQSLKERLGAVVA
jgi:50S ribosomal subunit-associated GTPase HflX